MGSDFGTRSPQAVGWTFGVPPALNGVGSRGDPPDIIGSDLGTSPPPPKPWDGHFGCPPAVTGSDLGVPPALLMGSDLRVPPALMGSDLGVPLRCGVSYGGAPALWGWFSGCPYPNGVSSWGSPTLWGQAPWCPPRGSLTSRCRCRQPPWRGAGRGPPAAAPGRWRRRNAASARGGGKPAAPSPGQRLRGHHGVVGCGDGTGGGM